MRDKGCELLVTMAEYVILAKVDKYPPLILVFQRHDNIYVYTSDHRIKYSHRIWSHSQT